VHFDEIA